MTNSQLKPAAALLIIGYVFLLVLRPLESICQSLFEIIFLYFLSNWTYFDFYPIINRLLFLLFYGIVIFKYLPGFNGQINLNELSKKFLMNLSFIGIGFSIISWFVPILTSNLSFNLRNSYSVNTELIAIKQLIISVLGLLEMIFVFIGYYRIIQGANNTNHS